MIGRPVITISLSAFLLTSCANKGGPPTHATLQLRDGTIVSGTVLASSSGEMRIAGDDSMERTIPMSQIRSVDYGDATIASAGGTPTGTAATAAPDPTHDQHYHPEDPTVTTKTFVIEPGTSISVRNEETIDSARAVEGQTFAAEVTKDVLDAAGDCVIPHGANAQIVIKSAAKGGHFRGASDLVLDLNAVSVGGRQYQLDTANVVERGHDGVGANKRTAKFAGGGAVVGAVIGAIAGHGKGAAIGAGSGAGAGVLTEVLTKGPSVRVPVESVLTFKLEQPVQVTAAQ